MSGAGSGYELNAWTFSPDGRLFQVEYAGKAVDKGGLTIGVRCSDGVLLVVEKEIPSALLAPGSNSRIYWVDSHIACATVGYRPDCFAAVQKARREAENYFRTFGCKVSVPELVSRLGFSFHMSHGYLSKRPFGCALLFASVDGENCLYALEPSGQYFGYFGCCFGQHAGLARTELEQTEWNTITVNEAVPKVAAIIRGMPKPQDKSKSKWEIEMVTVRSASGGRPEKVSEDLFAVAT
jgi:20S proteasome subunit alpha 7